MVWGRVVLDRVENARMLPRSFIAGKNVDSITFIKAPFTR